MFRVAPRKKRRPKERQNKSSHIVFGKHAVDFSIFLTVVFALKEGSFSAAGFISCIFLSDLKVLSSHMEARSLVRVRQGHGPDSVKLCLL